MITSRPFYSIRVVLVSVFISTSLCVRTMATSMAPSNVALAVGSRAILRCAAGVPTVDYVRWNFVATGTSVAVLIAQRRDTPPCAVTAGYPQYAVNDSDTTVAQCDLILKNVTESQAGWYQCTPSTAIGAISVNALVTVLYTDPDCSQNVTSNVAVGDDVLMKCEVSYSSGGMNASMTWDGCKYHNLSTKTTTAGNTTTTMSEIYVDAQQPYLEDCTCNTAVGNVSSPIPPALKPPSLVGDISSSTEPYSSAWNSKVDILVQYCPDNVTLFPPMNSVLPPNSVVTCKANGYPSPFYQLYVDNQTTLTLFNSSSLTLSDEGLYNVTCKATIYITSAQQGNYSCTNESMMYVYNISSEASSPTSGSINSSATPSPVTTQPTTPSPTNGTVIQTKESECTDPCCPITCILPICVVCGTAVLVGACVAIYFFWRHKNTRGIETTPQRSLKETPNGTENEIADYEMRQTATQSQPDVTRHSPGGYPPSQQEPPLRTPEILPVSKVDPSAVVYSELQPQPQVDNRTGSRLPLQFKTDNTNEYSHVKYA